MIQSDMFIESLGWFLVIGGVFLIFLAIILSFSRKEKESTQYITDSKGIIFLGPIPIVWGYGKKTKMISVIGIVAILLFIVFVILP